MEVNKRSFVNMPFLHIVQGGFESGSTSEYVLDIFSSLGMWLIEALGTMAPEL